MIKLFNRLLKDKKLDKETGKPTNIITQNSDIYGKSKNYKYTTPIQVAPTKGE